MKKRFSRWNIQEVKRNDEIESVLRNNPFLYHKKKYVISSSSNDGNIKDGENTNKESLVFQDENKKQIKSIKTEPGQQNKRYHQLIKSGMQSLSPDKYALNKNLLFSNYKNHSLGRRINDNSYPFKFNSIDNGYNINKAFSYDENYYLPMIAIKKSATDITDNNYYDKISRQLKMKLNKNYLDYNQEIINKRKSPNNANKMPYIKNNNELALPIGGISNPNYYNLGESKLSSNPIVNPGNRAPIFNQFRTHKLKSEFVY